MHARPVRRPSTWAELPPTPRLVPRQAERLAGEGLLADNPESLARAWSVNESQWSATLDRALGLPAGALDERVEGEWSFLETLRHLVHVTDGWLLRTVVGDPQPFHPLGLPPHFITDTGRLGLDLEARPSPDQVLACRADRLGRARELIATSSASDLERSCPGGWTVLGAIQVVMFEEWAHNQYATRDLRVLEERGRR